MPSAASSPSRKLRPMKLKDPVPDHPVATWIFLIANTASVIGAVQLAKYLQLKRKADSSPQQPHPLGSCAGHDLSGIPDTLIAMIPFFIALIIVEFALVKAFKITVAGAQLVPVDAWSSLAGGVQQLVTQEAFFRLIGARQLYCTIFDTVSKRFFPNFWPSVPENLLPLTTFLCFLYSDLIYYWFHRFTHSYGMGWFAHLEHHSGERYNLSTALRQSGFQSCVQIFFNFLFVSPLVPPGIYYYYAPFIPISQFWFHTCVVRQVPIPGFEFVLNTPSHHRVHHERRRHANHGGFLIIWDRIFGTFISEFECLADDKMAKEVAANKEEVVYFGVNDTIESWTEMATQIQWFRQHFSLRNMWYGPGYYVTKKQPLHHAILDDEPRIRQDDAPRGTSVNLFLLCSLFAAIYNSVYLLKAPVPLSTAEFVVSAALSPWLALYIQGLVADRNYASALLFEMVRMAYALFAGPLVAPHSATIAAISCLWIATMLNNPGQRKRHYASASSSRDLSLAREQ